MKDPAFLFYPNDWMGGTMGMTLEEKGAYMEVLMMQFNRGHMTEDMIVRMIGQLWLNVKHKFVVDEQGMWYNQRLDVEKGKRRSYTESRRNNREGTNQYSKRDGHMPSHMENGNGNNNTNALNKKNGKSFVNFKTQGYDLYADRIRNAEQSDGVGKENFDK
jgi:uncharacterized protein YdaU (DUF1376 family)